MPTLDPNNPLHLIPAALSADPSLVVCLPVFHPAAPNATLVLSAKLRTRRIPPELAAQLAQAEHEASGAGSGGNGQCVDLPTHMEVGRLLLTVPADIAENLRGPAVDRHPLFMIAVRREYYDAAVRQSESGIVLPGGVHVTGGRGGIVKP